MSLSKKQRDELVNFLIMNLRDHPEDIVKLAQEKFLLSRPAILRYVHSLVTQKIISSEGVTKNRRYSLLPTYTFQKAYPILPGLAEDKVWRDDIQPLLLSTPKNIFNICQYGFSEIFNNAMEHSEGNLILVNVDLFPDMVELIIADDGYGIFKKIQEKYHLDDPLQSILELSKGKLTTNPETHTGEGIFFTSKMFDFFSIHSFGQVFTADPNINMVRDTEKMVEGTSVLMDISLASERTTRGVFSQFTDEEFGFDKTIVPVNLARYGDENLISRSQARRLLARLEKFKTVILDFKNVSNVGRAFIDEIFRVFTNAHPGTKVVPINTSRELDQIIKTTQSSQVD